MKTNQLKAIQPPASFRTFLQAELARRCARSNQYSLRAFARFLELDHSTLSQLLRGKRRLTDRTIRRCGVRLGLDEDSIAEFTRAVSDKQGPSDDIGVSIVYSHRTYGKQAEADMAKWLEKNKAETEKVLMRWDAMPKLLSPN